MTELRRKAWRDVKRQRWQFVAVLVTVVLGVAMFAGTYNAYLNLGSSLEGTYDRLVMADMTVVGVRDGFVDDVVSIDGVSDAIDRRQADVPFQIGDDSLVGRVVGIPADDQPAINRLDIGDGTYLDPDVPNGIVLESHAANDFALAVGDSFEIVGTEVEVLGIATSTEYLWPARDNQSLFTAPKTFAVAFVDDRLLDGVDELAVIDQVLVRYDADADVERVDRAVVDAADGAGATQVQALADQPSNVAIQTEIDGLQTIAIALPLLFLAAAGMAVYVVVTRLVHSQRGVIGTLRASGFSRRQMRRHYLSYGLGVGLAGAAIGLVLGALMARGLTAIYTMVFGIPDLVADVHLPTAATALTFGASTGIVAGLPAARTVSRLAPAEAMRGDVPTTGGTLSIFERVIPPLRRAPVRWRMTLRGLGRNKKRSGSMVLGVVLGMTLILASWGLLDTMLLAVDKQFDEIQLEDATVAMTEPIDDAAVQRIIDVEGVAIAEPVVSTPATVGNASESLSSILEAYERGTEVHGFDPELTADGALLGRAMRDILDVGVGDRVTIDLPALDVRITTTVAGFVDEPLATAAYLERDTFVAAVADVDPSIGDAELAAPSITVIKAVFEDGADGDVVLDRIRDVDGVAAVVDANGVRDLVDEFQAFFYVFIGVMVVFGGALAFALIFNIISVNVAERSSEYASMRANGLTHRRVASLIVGETFVLVAVGIVPGWIVGYLSADALMRSFASAEFPITAEFRPLSFVAGAIAMFAVAGLSLLPAIRAVKRIDVGGIVRERAT